MIQIRRYRDVVPQLETVEYWWYVTTPNTTTRFLEWQDAIDYVFGPHGLLAAMKRFEAHL